MNTQLPALNVATAIAVPTPFIPLNYVHPGLSFAQVLSILRAHRRRIALIWFAVSATVIGIAALLPRAYDATATLLVRYEVNDPLGGKEFPVGLLSNYIATQIELLQSPGVLVPVIERLNLANKREYVSGFDGAVADLPAWIVGRMQRKLTITQGQSGSQLVHVRYTGRTPDQAAEVANAIAEVYVQQQNDRINQPAAAYANRYSEQLDSLRAKVERAQEQVTAFRERNGMVDPSGNIDIDMEVLATLEQKLLEAQSQKRAAEARATGDASVGSTVLNSPLVQSLKTTLATLTARRAELLSSLGRRHPDMVALEAQIRETRASLEAEVGVYSTSSQSELEAARVLTAKLQAALDEQRARILKVRQVRDEATRYQLELSSAQEVYKRALDGYDQAAYASQSRYNNVSIESRALKPLRPTRPNLLKYSVLGILLGGAVGLLVPFAMELLNRRVRCRDDLERDHGIPVLMEFAALPARRMAA